VGTPFASVWSPSRAGFPPVGERARRMRSASFRCRSIWSAISFWSSFSASVSWCAVLRDHPLLSDPRVAAQRDDGPFDLRRSSAVFACCFTTCDERRRDVGADRRA
jgi:hypothetical protein